MIVGTKFQLKLTILIFWTKFIQKRYISLKRIKLIPQLNSAYTNLPKYQISA